MSQSSSLLIVYTDHTTSELSAESMGAAFEQPQPHVVREGLLAAAEELTLRRTPPKYLIIDIGNRGMDVLPEIDRLAETCDPSIKAVVTGKLNDVSLYRALIQRGIVEYFAYPLDEGAIAKELLGKDATLHAPMRKSPRDAHQGHAIGFVSAASGDGASTIALNTAYVLANTFKKSTVLVDLDYQYGMIARHLDLKAPYGIRELLEYPERGVDDALIKKMLISYGDNLKIIAAPNELRPLPPVQPEQMIGLLAVLKSQFDYVILDIPHLWVEWIYKMQMQLDHNVLVAQLWLRSLTHVTRLLAAWRSAGIEPGKISLIINRSGSKFKEAMSAHEFERVANAEIKFSLANDTKAIVASENQGKTLIELGNSPLEKQITDIAQYLHTLCTGEAAEIAKNTKKSGLLGLLQK